jgi:hypothetical protein
MLFKYKKNYKIWEKKFEMIDFEVKKMLNIDFILTPRSAT